MVTIEEIEKAERIFSQIEPNTLRAVQAYKANEEFRNYIVIAKGLQYNRSCEMLYMNFDNLTPWQKKIFEKRSKKELPGKAFFEDLGKVKRLGFK